MALTVSTAIDFKGDAAVNITNTGTTTVAIDNLAAATNTASVTGASGKDVVDISAVAQEPFQFLPVLAMTQCH